MKKWLLSYICVLIVPFVFGCMLYGYSQASVQSEVDAIQEMNLRNMQTVVENAVEDARNISEALLCDEKVALLMNLPEGAGYSEAALIQEITGMIRHYQTANHLFSSITINMSEQEYLLSESACYRYRWVEPVAESFLGMEYAQFERLMEEENYNHFFINRVGEDYEGIYVHSSWRYQEKKAPVVILIRYDMDLLGEMLVSGEYLTCLYDAKQDCYFSAGEWQQPPEDLVEQVLAGKNRDYFLLQQELTDSGIWVMNLVEKSQYLSPIKQMQYILFIYVLICLLAGGAIAWYMARKSYSPVRELADLAKQMEQRFYGSEEHRDEFSLIKASLERLSKDYAEQRSIASERNSIASEHRSLTRKSEQYARETLLARFLQERSFGRQEVFQAYELLHDLFGEDDVLLLAYEAEEQEETEEAGTTSARLHLKTGKPGQSLADRLELPFFVLKNITEELTAGEYPSFCLECEGFLLCLFGVPKESGAEALSKLREVAERVCVYAREYFHYSIVADISALHQNGKETVLAYQEVRELIRFRDMIGSPLPVIVYEEFRQDNSEEGAKHYRQIRRLQQLIDRQQYKEAAKVLELLYQEPEEATLPKQAGEEDDHIEPEEKMREVAAYIDSHYADKNLTVGFLADMLGFGLSNLSQMFKRYRNCGLLDYINQVRLEQAKLLLLEGKTVKEAADLVGFYTTRPLTNLFNQFEGTTPMKWKNQKQQETKTQ